jgi:hypothetical protein
MGSLFRSGARTWPFDQAEDVAAITTRQVLEDRLPVLLVMHYQDDHSWAFLCGTTAESSDARVLSMREVLERDPTLASIADLPPGCSARREAVGASWYREVEE